MKINPFAWMLLLVILAFAGIFLWVAPAARAGSPLLNVPLVVR